MSLFTTAGGGSTQLDDAYEISNSLCFNDGDSTYLSKTFGTATSRKTWTYSFWVKRGIQGTQQNFLGADAGGNTNNNIRFRTDNAITFFHQVSSSDTYYLTTTQVFRDVSAWYHIVFVFNSTESTSTNRLKMYVNGSQITDFASSLYPSLNYDDTINSNVAHEIGRRGSGMYADFYMAEVAFLDGQALAPTSFAETNNQGIWVPKEFKDDVTFGNNGFYLEFKQTGTSANSSGMGADTSGNDNHFTPNNLAAKNVVQDTPTNNFMTWNPLYTNSRGTFAEGNRQVETNVQGVVPYGGVEFGNFHVNSGKWYWEVEVVTVGSGLSLGLGASERAYTNTYTNGHNNAGSSGNFRYAHDNGQINMGATNIGTGATYTNGDTIMFAMDLDNSKFYTGKNGTWNNSQDPANGTNAWTLVATGYGDYWTPWISKDSDTYNAKVYLNTGNPVLANDSGNADGNGYGDFEYAVPSGYYALCTKNIAQYG